MTPARDLCRIMRETLGSSLSEEERAELADAILSEGWRCEKPDADIEVDAEACLVRIGDRRLPIRPAPARLLECLLRRKVASKDWLMQILWGDEDVQEQNLRVQICNLRALLAPFGYGIGCRWGVGYTLLSPGETFQRKVWNTSEQHRWKVA